MLGIVCRSKNLSACIQHFPCLCICMFFNSFQKRSVSLANVAAATFRTCKLVYNVGLVLFRYFVFVFERIIINPLISNGIIKFYCRYVDNTLLQIKHNDIEFLLNKLHTFHRDIRFTYDTFSDEPPHFLDLNIGGNKFSIYRKHTFTGQYTHFVSFVPWKHRMHGFALFYVVLPQSAHLQN